MRSCVKSESVIIGNIWIKHALNLCAPFFLTLKRRPRTACRRRPQASFVNLVVVGSAYGTEDAIAGAGGSAGSARRVVEISAAAGARPSWRRGGR